MPRSVVRFGLFLSAATLFVAPRARAQEIIVIEQREPLPPSAQAPAPQPPPQYGAGTQTAPDGTVWVPVPPGYRLTLEPVGAPPGQPYIQPQQGPLRLTPDLEYRLDRVVRRSRRAGYIQLAAAGATLIAMSLAIACEVRTDEYFACDGYWSATAAGFVGFSAAGIVSAFSANRAAGILRNAGVPIRRGAGRFAIALSFVPYANISAFVFTTMTLGRVRRARANMPRPYVPAP